LALGSLGRDAAFWKLFLTWVIWRKIDAGVFPRNWAARLNANGKGESLKYPQKVIDDVCRQVDFMAYVMEFVELKPTGMNWSGTCPFHADERSSFFVNPEKNIYFCKGCEEGGGPLSFSIKVTGRSFWDCLKDLAHRANYALPVYKVGENEYPLGLASGGDY
jgi:hypothetical protein